MRRHNDVKRKSQVDASSSESLVQSVPQTIYISAAVAGSTRKFHLNSTCRHLVGATHSVREAIICKTCEKNPQASD